MTTRYNGFNNGEIGFGWRAGCVVPLNGKETVEKTFGLSRHQVGRALDELESSGFTITPTQNNALVIATIGPWSEDGAGAGYSVGGGFTIRTSIQPASGNAAGAAIADLLQTTAAGVNPTWSGWGGSNGPRVGGTLVAFKT